jgi:hypothetical protein
MNQYLLHHIYQAWQQGNENCALNYKEFVSYASIETNNEYYRMLEFLKTCNWFLYIDDDK